MRALSHYICVFLFGVRPSYCSVVAAEHCLCNSHLNDVLMHFDLRFRCSTTSLFQHPGSCNRRISFTEQKHRLDFLPQRVTKDTALCKIEEKWSIVPHLTRRALRFVLHQKYVGGRSQFHKCSSASMTNVSSLKLYIAQTF